MNTLELLIPVYRKLNQRFKNSLLWFLKARVKELDVEITVKKVTEWFTKVKLQGNDTKTASLFLKKQFGNKTHISKLSKGKEYAGNLIKIEQKTVIVDIGLRNPRYYITIPFKEITKKILDEKTKSSPQKMFQCFGIQQYFPFYVTPKVLFPTKKKKYLRGSPGSETVTLLQEWLNLPYNRVLVYGETRGKIKKALSKSGHGKDILNIERLGFLECTIICKKGTSAIGLIPEIGPFLKEAELSAFQVD